MLTPQTIQPKKVSLFVQDQVLTPGPVFLFRGLEVLLLFLDLFYFLYVRVLPACLLISGVCVWCSGRSEGTRFP